MGSRSVWSQLPDQSLVGQATRRAQSALFWFIVFALIAAMAMRQIGVEDSGGTAPPEQHRTSTPALT